MALQDRDYYREAGDGPSGIDAATWIVRLVIVYVAVYLANLLLGPDFKLVERYLALQGDSLVHPRSWYQFFTAGWAYDANALGRLFWALCTLLIFGRDVEDRLGSRELLRVFLVALLFGNLVWGVKAWLLNQSGFVFGGASAVTALVLLSCLSQPRRRLNLFTLFRVPAWIVGTLLLAINLLVDWQSASSDGRVLAYELYLAGGLFAVAYWHLHWNFGRWWIALGGGRLKVESWIPARAKPRPEVQEVELEEPWDEDLETEADHLLEKVHTQGADSLTRRERRILEEYSRRVREKRR